MGRFQSKTSPFLTFFSASIPHSIPHDSDSQTDTKRAKFGAFEPFGWNEGRFLQSR